MKWNSKMQWYAKTIRAFRRQVNNGQLFAKVEVVFGPRYFFHTATIKKGRHH